MKKIWGIAWPPLLFLATQFIVTLVYVTASMLWAVLKLVIAGALSAAEIAEIQPEALQELVMTSVSLHAPVIISACVTFLVIFLNLKREWAAEGFWSFEKINAPLVFLCVSLGVALNIFITCVLAFIPAVAEYEQPFEELLGDNLVLMLFTLAVISPFLEEVIFRGLVQKRLSRMMYIPGAVILQAFIFGAIHLNLLQGAYAFVLGIIIGAVYFWHDSIWAPVIIHVAFNATSVIISYIFDNAAGIEINGIVLIIITVATLAVSALSMGELFRRKNNKI